MKTRASASDGILVPEIYGSEGHRAFASKGSPEGPLPHAYTYSHISVCFFNRYRGCFTSKGTSEAPSEGPSKASSKSPSEDPSKIPSEVPSKAPSGGPSKAPRKGPSKTLAKCVAKALCHVHTYTHFSVFPTDIRGASLVKTLAKP